MCVCPKVGRVNKEISGCFWSANSRKCWKGGGVAHISKMSREAWEERVVVSSSVSLWLSQWVKEDLSSSSRSTQGAGRLIKEAAHGQSERKLAYKDYTPPRNLHAAKWKGAPRNPLWGDPPQTTLIIHVGSTTTIDASSSMWDHFEPKKKSSSLTPISNQLLKKICPPHLLFSIPNFRRATGRPRRGSRSRYF